MLNNMHIVSGNIIDYTNFGKSILTAQFGQSVYVAALSESNKCIRNFSLTSNAFT